jgi:nicotinamide mononucleotide adenylyltransferase
MKKFSELVEEKNKHLVMLFGRMNPPTKGHEENVEGMKKMAQRNGADHLVVASHSQDAKKNPLSPDVKLKHLKRSFPDTNVITSSKEKPSIMHHAADAYKKGYSHLTVVAGADRVPEYERLLNHYNGKFKDEAGTPVGHGGYNFKSIKVVSTGERKKGISGTDMRNHAQNNDFKSFHANLSSSMRKNPNHAKELFHDVRKGMGLNEDTNRGIFKAIFVTGGPGSGKDIVIREAISEQKAVEINITQAYDFLCDKHKLAEKTNDYRRESIRLRGPLIINGPADSGKEMIWVKEELEELGYQTMMVFVDTTNEVSKQRNMKLSKMISESMRQEKWMEAQKCKESYQNCFDEFIYINNSGSYQEIEDDITDTYKKINTFIEGKNYNEIASYCMENRGKNETTSTLKENDYVKKNSRFFENYKTSRAGKTPTGYSKISTGGPRAEGPGDITPDNRASDTNTDNIKWDAPKRTKTYTFRTYSEAKGTPQIKVYPQPKETNFSKDKEKVKKKGIVDAPTVSQRMRNVTSLGPEFDTRQQGTVYPMSGLGDVTYREEKNFRNFKKFLESHMDPGDNEMGVGGVLGGSTNKEPMENPKDKLGQTYTIKKNKKK